MPSWTTVTTSDLNDTKVAALVSALRTAALAQGQSDPSTNIIADVVTTIRNNIKSCAANELDITTTKIPPSLKRLACRMIVREMQSRLRIALNDDERNERSADERTLERIARCELKVDETDTPETTATVQAGSNTPRINEPSRTFSRTAQDGI